jgi:hypothetical protein
MPDLNTIQDLLAKLDISDEKLIALQQGALATKPEVLSRSLKDALSSKVDFDDPKSAALALQGLQTIAEFSPQVANKLGELSNAAPATVSENPQLLNKLQTVFAEITQTNELQQVDADLYNALDLAAENVKQKRKTQAQMLSAALSKSHRRQATLDDADATVQKGIKGKSDNAPFDTLRALGHLIALLILLDFIVPIDEENNYARGFKYVAPTSDSVRDLYKEIYPDTDVLPTEEQMAAKQALPWIKTY